MPPVTGSSPSAARCDTRRVEPQPTIELDESFVLDGWTPGDAAAHRRFAEDETAARFLGWTVPEARAQPNSHYLAVVERFRSEWAEGSRLSFAIRSRVTGEAVGAVELRPSGTSVAVSYLVARDFRGRGLASLALVAVLGWAKDAVGAERALLTCHVENVASQRVALRCGFRLERRGRADLHFCREL